MTSGAQPLPELDWIAVRIANLGASIGWPLDGSPCNLHSLLLQYAQCVVHVIYLEREALPAEPLLGTTRRNSLGCGIAHDLDGRAAKLKVYEIKWTERGVGNAHA